VESIGRNYTNIHKGNTRYAFAVKLEDKTKNTQEGWTEHERQERERERERDKHGEKEDIYFKVELRTVVLVINLSYIVNYDTFDLAVYPTYFDIYNVILRGICFYVTI
jgi:hypothetical protein